MSLKHFLIISIFLHISFGQVAKQKCQEYSALVYKTSESPVLLPQNTPQNESECGIVEVPLIIGGQKAGPKEFPHMAEIGFDSYGNINWHCGGTVIGEKTVLSAGHCVDHIEDGSAKVVRVGAISHSDLTNAQTIPISERLVHPEFSRTTKYNDICIFKLEQPIVFNAFVRPACLNTDGNYQWEKAIVIGFGKTQHDSDAKSDNLMKIQLFKFSQEECQVAYKDNPSMTQGVLPSQFCAGEKVDEKDSCQGDSGGPIQTVLSDPYCMYNVIGVVSFGKLCGFANTPGIYTDIASYIPWIESNAWN